MLLMSRDKTEDEGGPLVRLVCNMLYRDETPRKSLGVFTMKCEKYKQAIGCPGPSTMSRKKPPP